jgi:hypothetical protein
MKSMMIFAIGVAMTASTQLQAAAMLSCVSISARPAVGAAPGEFGVNGVCRSNEAFSVSLRDAGSLNAGWRGPIRLAVDPAPSLPARAGPGAAPWELSAAGYPLRWYGALALHNRVVNGWRGGNHGRGEREFRDWDDDQGEGRDDEREHHWHHRPPAPAPVPLPASGPLAAIGVGALLALGGRRRWLGGRGPTSTARL